MAPAVPPVAWRTPAPLVATAATTSAVLSIGPGVGQIRVVVGQRGRQVREAGYVAPPAAGGLVRVPLDLPPGESTVAAIPAGGRAANLPARRIEGSVAGFAALLDRLREAVVDPDPTDGARPVFAPRDYRAALAGVVALNRSVRGFGANSRARREARYSLRLAAGLAASGRMSDRRLRIATATITRNADFWRRPPADLGDRNVRLRTTGTLRRFDWRYLTGRGIGIQPLGTVQRLEARGRPTGAAYERQLEAVLELGVPRTAAGGDRWIAAEYPWFAGADPGGGPYWASAMTNATIAAQLAKAYIATKRPRYLDLMRGYVHGLAIPFSAGGLGAPSRDGTWFLEVGTSSRLRILNGHLQAVVSLGRIDRLLGGREPEVHRLFRRGVAETVAHLADYDEPDGWSAYSLGRRRAPEFYQGYHVTLLRSLATSTRQPIFTRYADRWARALAAYRRGANRGPGVPPASSGPGPDPGRDAGAARPSPTG